MVCPKKCGGVCVLPTEGHPICRLVLAKKSDPLQKATSHSVPDVKQQ